MFLSSSSSCFSSALICLFKVAVRWVIVPVVASRLLFSSSVIGLPSAPSAPNSLVAASGFFANAVSSFAPSRLMLPSAAMVMPRSLRSLTFALSWARSCCCKPRTMASPVMVEAVRVSAL
ncbi:hypothetical protein D3C81_1847840 [compost metagenome]